MGNYVSSCTLISPSMKSSRAARVIFPGGEIRHFREPVKAAELMLDCPSFFVVNYVSMNVGKRFAPLSADEDLEFVRHLSDLPVLIIIKEGSCRTRRKALTCRRKLRSKKPMLETITEEPLYVR
ncbi:hypothetical protein POM88_018215 [Heracleum sosnowskyi]|uniref:Uncharacterized protein n=1 Tax=Heracleum sosnowskyi TaxID=360622 RepID=A0AAD8IQ43_9APIA|nr:hypothetical protein POM88_018215 [Heracleum sosnowskyi]